MGAADSDDLSRWLIAWVWHNPNAKDQIWSLMEAAKRMGGKITEAQASAITEEASITRKHLTADRLGRFLGLNHDDRRPLGITTIGDPRVNSRARREIRQIRNKVAKERRRRALGMRPQSESLSQTRPWEALKMSRRSWYRMRAKNLGTAIVPAVGRRLS